MALNYKQTAEDIVRLTGGPENIQTVAHCMTRLRFTVKNLEAADQEALKKVPGVLGVIFSNGQLMVVMGQNLLPVFEQVQKNFDIAAGQNVNENLDGNVGGEKKPLTWKTAGQAALDYVSAAVTPLVPGLVAGGLLKVILLLINLAFPEFSSVTAYSLLSAAADAPFYFMPVFVAYGAAKKLGGTTVYAMICAAALLHSNYTGLVAAGDPVNFLGIPVRLMSYSSSLLPALLIALCAYYAEKFFNRIVPGIFKAMLVGMGTIAVTTFLGFTVLAPVGGYVGNYMGLLFAFLGDTVGPVAVAVLAGCLPWIIMCGMHVTFGAFMAQSIANPGYDALFRPALILHNMAEGGSCIGVALRTKNREFRAETLSIAFGCIIAGVSEPAIYGVNLRLKRPMYGVMAGGAAGGAVAGIFGCRAYVMGYSTVLALPIFENTMLAMAGAVVTAIVVAAVVTFALGFEEEKA